MANAIAKIPISLPTTLATVFIWCLLIIVYGPLERGAGVAAWTNDVLPKLKLKFGKPMITFALVTLASNSILSWFHSFYFKFQNKRNDWHFSAINRTIFEFSTKTIIRYWLVQGNDHLFNKFHIHIRPSSNSFRRSIWFFSIQKCNVQRQFEESHWKSITTTGMEIVGRTSAIVHTERQTRCRLSEFHSGVFPRWRPHNIGMRNKFV